MLPRGKPGLLEVALGLALTAWLGLHFTGASLAGEFLMLLVASGLAIATVIKLARKWSRRILWRIRNRIIVVYLLVAVIPTLVIIALITYSAISIAGQIGVSMVYAELRRQVAELDAVAGEVAHMPAERRVTYLGRMTTFYEEHYPGFQLILQEPGRPAPAYAPPAGWGSADGIVVREKFLYCWARSVHEGTAATILVPITRVWLADLTPGIGDVSIIPFPNAALAGSNRVMLTQDSGEPEGTASAPPPENRFDFDLLWASPVRVAVWETPGAVDDALLAVHSRMSSVARLIFSLPSAESAIPSLLVLLGISYVIIQAVSTRAGIQLTRTITTAVQDLDEGTKRVRSGDLSHRIPVHGHDQLAELTHSFNRMTQDVQRLVAVSKEKERLEAELEIAREVQQQLFPRSAPQLGTLEVRAMCQPARMVSGDYYDYQQLGDGRMAMALGDVAGKGISAALLMATLQSSLRTHLRNLMPSSAPVSTSDLMTKINTQLYSDTAPEKYATFYLSVYDDRDGYLTYTNAGHLPPLLVRRNSVIPLESNGLVVGAFPFAVYQETRVALEPGDLLVAFTDGITETENEFGEMFGDSRLAEVLVKFAHLGTQEVLDSVIEAVRNFATSPELHDDMTLIAARRIR